ncbi:MAG: MraY family glycosyltransferase [Candidatus Buchananbacteria bacterium]
MSTFYFLPFILSFFCSLFLTPIVKKVAVYFEIVDKPGPRKIHQNPIALLGGVAIYFSFVITTLVFWSFGYVSDVKISNLYIFGIIIAGAILMIGGYFDDRYSLKPWQQLIFPIAAVLLVLLAGIRIQNITNPFGGIIVFPFYFGVALTFFWLLATTYTSKILDGLDGLVSGITAIASIIIFIVSLYWDVPLSGTSIMALILAGACLGFLLFNWHPAKIFLGEGGSVFCGFLLGILSVISGSKIATALLIMGIPLLDIVLIVILRLWQGKSPVSGDNKHLHFRLLEIGLSHRQAVIFLYCLVTAFGTASLFLHSKGKIIALGVLVLLMLILAVVLFAIYRVKNEKKSS